MSALGPKTGRDRAMLPRLAAALLVLCVLSVFTAVTGIVVGGVLAWLVGFVIAIPVQILLLPVVDNQDVLFSRLFSNAVTVVAVSGVLLLPLLYLRPVRREIRRFREELGATGDPAARTHPAIAATARRLAQQANAPEPDVYVADRRRAESYAVGGRSHGTIVLTTGLVSQLSDDEVAAVIAHEISHLVNGDSRLMGVALAPMLVAEQIGSEDPPDLKWVVRSPLGYLFSLLAWAVLSVVTAAQRLTSQLGIAVLSREREFAADRGAAKLTGSPADLAGALGKLDDARRRPDEDKRTWARSASALDILPREGSVAGEGPFRTHPGTETRIERLERLAVEMETGS